MVKPANKVRLRVLLIFAVAVAAVSLIVWTQSRRRGQEPATVERIQPETQPSPTSSAPLTGASASVSPVSDPLPADMKAEPGASLENNQPLDPTVANSFIGTLKLIIPVGGVKPDQLLDTYTDSRSEGRVHDAIDIPAPAGTAVLAVADGEIIKLFQSERGGITIYQLSTNKKLLFYYAHLQRYAEGIAVGKYVRQGEVIAFVGDTGNAGAGNYHLHLSISIPPDPKRYWEGKNINPYQLLRGK